MKNTIIVIFSWCFVFCDQILKAHAAETMNLFERTFILGQKWLTLTRVHNLGLMMGKYSNIPRGYNEPYIYYFPAACLSLLICVAVLRYRESGWIERVSVSLMIAGGLSNLWDHWRNGRVIDTFELYVGAGLYMPFNLADVGLMMGGLGMIICLSRAFNTVGKMDARFRQSWSS